jgi:hypothetical protein
MAPKRTLDVEATRTIATGRKPTPIAVLRFTRQSREALKGH